MIVQLDLLDRWSRPVTAELAVRRDTVEVRCRDAVAGVADRALLRCWLADPHATLAYDDVAWLSGPGGVALSIGDLVPCWWLADHVLLALRERL